MHSSLVFTLKLADNYFDVFLFTKRYSAETVWFKIFKVTMPRRNILIGFFPWQRFVPTFNALCPLIISFKT